MGVSNSANKHLFTNWGKSKVDTCYLSSCFGKQKEMVRFDFKWGIQNQNNNGLSMISR
jgi:hypothetical protein